MDSVPMESIVVTVTEEWPFPNWLGPQASMACLAVGFGDCCGSKLPKCADFLILPPLRMHHVWLLDCCPGCKVGVVLSLSGRLPPCGHRVICFWIHNSLYRCYFCSRWGVGQWRTLNPVQCNRLHIRKVQNDCHLVDNEQYCSEGIPTL